MAVNILCGKIWILSGVILLAMLSLFNFETAFPYVAPSNDRTLKSNDVDYTAIIPQDPDETTTEPMYFQTANRLKDCIMESTDLWAELVHRTAACVANLTMIRPAQLLHLPVGRFKENKVFLDFDEKRPAGGCQVLTIGIGGDIAAEKKLAKVYPTCKFYGMDPMQDQGSIYRQVGKFLPFGLSLQGGRLNMTVRKQNGAYSRAVGETITVETLLNSYLQGSIVHFATLDIEGGEYELLGKFERGQSIDRSGLVLCQIDLELHAPSRYFPFYSFKRFHHIMKEFLLNTDYVPIYATNHIGKLHRKTTLINFGHPDCVLFFGMDKLLAM